MKIFVTHSSNFDFKNDLYAPLQHSELYWQHTIMLPQIKRKEVITREIIKSCDLIVAEVSYPSTGQGIELGWANVFAIPIVCVYKKGHTYSSSVTHITNVFIAYKNSKDLIFKLTKVVQSFEQKNKRL